MTLPKNSVSHTINTPLGVLNGISSIDPVSDKIKNHRFAKIPYAQPFSQHNRWKRPVKLPSNYDYSGNYYEMGLKAPQSLIEDEKLSSICAPGDADENINYLNIWIPASKDKPVDGWPVFIYIHGGFLKYGSPGRFPDPKELQSHDFLGKYIIVSIGYRLNILGFLNSTELLSVDSECSNLGFWDQRLAIEWVYDNIKYFEGNNSKITVGGLSAGSYSTFFQLAYELYHPEVTQVIKQVVQFSNAFAMQPKTISEVNKQYYDVLDNLGISRNLSPELQLQQLREQDVNTLVSIIPKLKYHTFRAVTDNNFVAESLLSDLVNGQFSQLLMKRKPGFRMVIGEVANEPYLYSLLDTPIDEMDLKLQLENYYPARTVQSLIDLYPKIPQSLPEAEYREQLQHLFGRIVADSQIYASTRGFIHWLVENGYPKENIFRYRVGYRQKRLDKSVDPKLGAIHGSDLAVWFSVRSSSECEKNIIESFLRPFNKILNFEDQKSIEWGTLSEKEYRFISPGGEVNIVSDADWDWGVHVSNTLYLAQSS